MVYSAQVPWMEGNRIYNPKISGGCLLYYKSLLLFKIQARFIKFFNFKNCCKCLIFKKFSLGKCIGEKGRCPIRYRVIFNCDRGFPKSFWKWETSSWDFPFFGNITSNLEIKMVFIPGKINNYGIFLIVSIWGQYSLRKIVYYTKVALIICSKDVLNILNE